MQSLQKYFAEFYVLCNPPLLPPAVSEIVQKAKSHFGETLKEILYDPDVPWFKCITEAHKQPTVSRFIEEKLLELIEDELASADADGPGSPRNDGGELVDFSTTSDDPMIVPWATYTDPALTQYSDYDEFRYPAVILDCPYKAVWRGFEQFPESQIEKFVEQFMNTVNLVSGSFLVPTEIHYLGPHVGCDKVACNLTGSLLFIGGDTQESIDKALLKIDNIFDLTASLATFIIPLRLMADSIIQQHRTHSNDLGHLIAACADDATSGLSYRWLTHLSLAKRTYLSDDMHGMLLTPDKDGRSDPSKGASLRLATQKNEHTWEVDVTSYSQMRPSESGGGNFGPFDGFQYPDKPSSIRRARSQSSQTRTGAKELNTGAPSTYANAVGSLGRGRSQARTSTPAIRTTSAAASDVSRASRVSSTAPSASSTGRPPSVKETLLATNPNCRRGQNQDLTPHQLRELEKWIRTMPSQVPEVGDLMSFNELDLADPTPSPPPKPSGPPPSTTRIDLSHPPPSVPPTLSSSVEQVAPTGQDGSQDQPGEASDSSEDLIDFGVQEHPVKKLHETMKQRAGRRSKAKNQQRLPLQSQPVQSRSLVPGAPSKPHIDLSVSLSSPSPLIKTQILNNMKMRVQSLAQNLQIISGEVRLELKFGRLYIQNPSSSTISDAASVSSDLVWDFDAARQELQNIPLGKVGFQPILSSKGADANLLVQIHEPGEPRWRVPDASAFYRFVCYHAPLRICFNVDIDSDCLSHKCRGLDEDIDHVHIHCPEYAWDMKICATRARIDFPEDFLKFAAELVNSLGVSTDSNGVTTITAAGNPARGFVIQEACVVHLARYQSKSEDGRLLVVKMTKPVFRTRENNDMGVFHGIVGLPKDKQNRAGFVSQWFEASIQSAKAEEVFRLNKSLEMGEKAGWTGEELDEAGVFEGICRLGLAMIPKMDSIGWANDNGYSASMSGTRTEGSSGQYVSRDNGFW